MPLSFNPAATRVLGLVIRSHSLEHPELEFSGPSQDDGLVASPGFINAIGGLLPSPVGPNLVVVSAPSLQLFGRIRKRQEPASVHAAV